MGVYVEKMVVYWTRKNIVIAPTNEPSWVTTPIQTKDFPPWSLNIAVMASLMKLIMPISSVHEPTCSWERKKKYLNVLIDHRLEQHSSNKYSSE